MTMLKKISNIIFFTFTLCISAYANNATPPDSTNKVVPLIEMNGKSWVDGSIPFLTIHDVHRQAEVWAICALKTAKSKSETGSSISICW